MTSSTPRELSTLARPRLPEINARDRARTLRVTPTVDINIRDINMPAQARAVAANVHVIVLKVESSDIAFVDL